MKKVLKVIAAVRDLQFQYSDHNPVAMTFELRSPR